MSVNNGISKEEAENTQLRGQKDLLRLLAEIIQESIKMTSFQQVIRMLSDKYVRRIGVKNCYLWFHTNEEAINEYNLYIRSVEIEGELKYVLGTKLPEELYDIKEPKIYGTGEIKNAIVDGIKIPGSRIVIPIGKGQNRGMTILEHDKKDFFDDDHLAFFEASTSFLASKEESFRVISSVAETSLKDPLTQTYNRRHLKEAIITMYAQYKKITLAIIDTDNFKTINDKFGHTEGDTVLKAIAQLAQGSVKDFGGEVVRYGGDEFIVILPLALKEATEIIENYRKCVHYLKIPYDFKLDLSITIGVCSCPEIVQDYTHIIEIADKALLRGKAKGKDCIEIATKEDAQLN